MNISIKINEKGITILEVLIAMIILSLALLMLLNMAMVALDGNDWSNKTTIATNLLQEKIEQLRGIENPTLGSYSDTVGDVVRNWQVSSAGNYLRQIDVQVVWEDIKSQTKTNSMTTYIRTDSI
ncbi:MAG: type IV pilus modification PilV family protein [Candidatus Zixiibacteriota bacterium]